MIKAAIVGVGWWGRTLVESVQGQSDQLTFVAAGAHRATPELTRFAETHRMRLFLDYESLLHEPSIDAVVLATPHSLHVPQLVAAANAHKHVYCEKPLALSLADAERAIEAVERNRVTLMVGYNRRFHPEMVHLREMVRKGELGTLLHVESTMSFPNALTLPAEHWRARREETPCGGLTPMGVHALDAMIDLCGTVSRVHCQSTRRAVPIDADDTTSILLSMDSGVSGYLGLMTATAAGFAIQVYGTAGTVRLEGTTHTTGATAEERRSRLFGECSFTALDGAKQRWEAAHFDVSRAALDAFARAAVLDDQPPIPYEQILHGVAVTEAVVRSAASRQPVTVARGATGSRASA